MGADHILVLDDGRMEAAGSHEQLMKTSETYRSIAQTQMQLQGEPCLIPR